MMCQEEKNISTPQQGCEIENTEAATGESLQHAIF